MNDWHFYLMPDPQTRSCKVGRGREVTSFGSSVVAFGKGIDAIEWPIKSSGQGFEIPSASQMMLLAAIASVRLRAITPGHPEGTDDSMKRNADGMLRHADGSHVPCQLNSS